MSALGLSGRRTGEGSRDPSCYIFLIFAERETLFHYEYDTRLNKTDNKRCASIRCCDHGSLPGGGGLELDPKRKRERQSKGRVGNVPLPSEPVKKI